MGAVEEAGMVAHGLAIPALIDITENQPQMGKAE